MKLAWNQNASAAAAGFSMEMIHFKTNWTFRFSAAQNHFRLCCSRRVNRIEEQHVERTLYEDLSCWSWWWKPFTSTVHLTCAALWSGSKSTGSTKVTGDVLKSDVETYTAAGGGCSNTSLESLSTGFLLPGDTHTRHKHRQYAIHIHDACFCGHSSWKLRLWRMINLNDAAAHSFTRPLWWL